MSQDDDAGSERAKMLEMLKDSAADFAAHESPFSRARALRGATPDFDRAFWGRLAEQGWTGLLVPEAHGGVGLGFAEMAAVLEAFAARVAPEPLVPSAVHAARLLQHAPESELSVALLGQVAAGETVAAVAWQEDPAQTAPDRIGCRVITAASGVRLQGKKGFVRPGSGADGFLVSVLESGEPALYWVPRDAAGLDVRSLRQADGSLLAQLNFDVAVDGRQRLARGAAALEALSRATDEALVMTSVELLTLCRAMLTMTLEYLRSRVQFGRPIGSFQALQHRAVDLFIQQELTAAVVGQAIGLLDGSATPTERAALASRAKARASDAALLIAREAVQLHGAIGFTDEYDLGLFFNRALVLSAWLGNGLAHRRRYAALKPLEAAA